MTALVIILVVLAVVAAAAVWMYNGLIRSRNRCDNAWSQIDVQLKRRYDLIPNLVETVKGYATHERNTLEAVTVARANAMKASQLGTTQQHAQAETALTGALKSLFALGEAYPTLKANQNFLTLQEELTSTEDRIAFARQYFNDAVVHFNTQIQTVPRNLIAGPLHFSARELFEPEPAASAPVSVTFGPRPS